MSNVNWMKKNFLRPKVRLMQTNYFIVVNVIEIRKAVANYLRKMISLGTHVSE